MGSVHIDYRTISWGGPNEDDNTDVWQIESGANDPGQITLEDFGWVGTPISNFPAPDTYTFSGNVYHRAFWNIADGVNVVSGYPKTGKFLDVPDQPGLFSATAWYVLLAGDGRGPPVLRCRTFDVDVNNFRRETPIDTATPSGAWPGPNNHSVSTKSAAAAATAKGALLYPAPVPSQPPGEPAKYFKSWLKIAGSVNADPPPGKVVKGEAKHSGLAVAFFGHGNPINLGKPSLETIFDFWAEFWGKKGAEGTGPWGPGGPGGPWGPLTQRWFEKLSPAEQSAAIGMLAAKISKGAVMP